MKEPDIVRIVNDGVVPRLEDLDLARDYNADQLQKHYRNNTEVPYTYIKDIDFATMAKFSEHDVGLPGVDVAIKPVRPYVYGALAAHLLGYVGAPDDTNTEEARRLHFLSGDVEGKSHIEQTMDEYLRGQPGMRVMRRNVKGDDRRRGRAKSRRSRARMFTSRSTRGSRHRRGGPARRSAAAPRSWSIRTTATSSRWLPCRPSIRTCSSPASRRRIGMRCATTRRIRLINRAVSAFRPGSTFKIVTALAGLRKGLDNTRFNCSGGVSYGDHYFKCWINEKGGRTARSA